MVEELLETAQDMGVQGLDGGEPVFTQHTGETQHGETQAEETQAGETQAGETQELTKRT